MNARLGYLAAAANGTQISGNHDMLIDGVFTDTRTPVCRGLFIALRGDNFDGNKYASAAIQRGASAVMIDDPKVAAHIPQNVGVILVDDTRAGYLGIAAAHRQKANAKFWFGITGSVGKSTSKEMLAHVLMYAGFTTHKAAGSFNNAVGLSHTVLGADEKHDAVVLELGTNHPGEIRQLADVARPNIALITCAAESHLEAFHTVENVAREKGDILAFQQSQDVAILNADSLYLLVWLGLVRGKHVTFGAGELADVRAKHIRINASGCAEFIVRCGDEIADCALRVPGAHQVSNATGVIAAAMAAGVSLQVAATAMCLFDGISRRMTINNVAGITVIDDAYNANPASFAAALETLKSIKAERKFVVAGDMLELGAKSDELHMELGRHLAECDLDGLVTVGDLSALAGESAVVRGLDKDAWVRCEKPECAADALKPRLRRGDVVLIKGSHGVCLDQCVKLLSAG